MHCKYALPGFQQSKSVLILEGKKHDNCMKTPIFITLFFISNLQLFAQWETMDGPFGSYINDVGQNIHYIYAATTAGIYRSTDIGVNWSHISFMGDTRFACLYLDVNDSVLVADAIEIRPDTLIRRMYKSEDEGNSWSEIPRPPVNREVGVVVTGNTIFADDSYAIWITQDDGMHWKQSNVNHLLISPESFERFGSKVYVGDADNLFV